MLVMSKMDVCDSPSMYIDTPAHLNHFTTMCLCTTQRGSHSGLYIKINNYYYMYLLYNIIIMCMPVYTHTYLHVHVRYTYMFLCSNETFQDRTLLAILDHNHHLHVAASGETHYNRVWRRRSTVWDGVACKEEKNYSYIPNLLAKIFEVRSESDTSIR